jgi:hypothetical protein
MKRVLLSAAIGIGAAIGLATAAHAQSASDPGRPTAQSKVPGEIGVICLSNACMKASEPRRDPAAVARAIEAGDTAKVMIAGGTPEDVIAAMRSRLAKDPDAVLDPASPRQVALSYWMSGLERHIDEGESPRFIQNNGRTSLAYFDASGRLKAVTTIPGMNGPGIPARGEVYDVPVPPPPPPPPPSPAELLGALSAR